MTGDGGTGDGGAVLNTKVVVILRTTSTTRTL